VGITYKIAERIHNNTVTGHENSSSKKGGYDACKIKAIPLQPWTDPEGSMRLRRPDLKTVST
jgi:hypothetical protein